VKKPNEARLLFIVQKLKHGNYKTKSYAAIALGESGDRRAIEPLVNTLSEDGDKRVRRAAAWALGKIGNKKALPALKKALKDENKNVQEAAQKAINQIKSKRKRR
ncbi:HEAT repeat domain-containing protein, partial [bacterium]|nr:HEAT repeat domain-containing protein [bacterium]